ncbi:gamma-aminobutyric-acid receptor subunit beta [Vibrio gazogenes]|uniref:Neurotransmitter-gated ion-channel ligand binding domain-containing protein n=1 Tax=Vibrio gazogenes DSM 21264 = NBRC 103151 TaxID=1123492 RepID=A0A1M4UVX7_VIBGA|nr:gamma-aminobutyric-acid receptor subunit beta [Vibrio gazogenes]USP15664.1 gamma-aminobutyric-acid receptor subunit beta [Vibrio gazogenes]SHE60838.1 Neurotransmitter-gated ion-channel ligand binding domain-containing protein [Vibrio gazogenes DSM 21264] [Vibrio gazogenes DSM 21264 = NBRC 103151]SJN56114.1 Cys-loop ligand-gated ion channel [Vibrio gazogenes]
MIKKEILAVIVSLIWFCSPALYAQYVVDTSISINKIYGVNTVDQTYKVDGYLVTSWDEPDQTYRPASGERVYENHHADQLISDGLWVPAFEFINIIGQRQTANRRVVISADGRVTYNERFQGLFTTTMDFRQFPFDHQTFVLMMEPFSYEQQQLVFGSARINVEALENQALSEWQMQGKPQARVSRSDYTHLQSGMLSHFSRLTISIQALRKPDYYLWRFILPLSLILVASWAVFWIEGFSERLMTSFTMMLTVVAYTFYTSSLLPRLPYTTLIERMVIMGYVSIFAAIIVIVFVKIRDEKGRPVEHVIPRCRVIFPALFLIAMSVLIGVNGGL